MTHVMLYGRCEHTLKLILMSKNAPLIKIDYQTFIILVFKLSSSPSPEYFSAFHLPAPVSTSRSPITSHPLTFLNRPYIKPTSYFPRKSWKCHRSIGESPPPSFPCCHDCFRIKKWWIEGEVDWERLEDMTKWGQVEEAEGEDECGFEEGQGLQEIRVGQPWLVRLWEEEGHCLVIRFGHKRRMFEHQNSKSLW